MTWEADIARYREIHDEHRELSARIVAELPSRPETDAELADLLGWKEETVAKARQPKLPPKPKAEPSRERVLRQMTSQWETAESLIPRLATLMSWKRSSVKSLLRDMDVEGLIESKGHKSTYMGRSGITRTHYRKYPEVGA